MSAQRLLQLLLKTGLVMYPAVSMDTEEKENTPGKLLVSSTANLRLKLRNYQLKFLVQFAELCSLRQ
jgi:hypothetical protein